MPVGGTILSTLVDIAQGVSEKERIGRKCTIRSISVRGFVKMNNAIDADNTTNSYRYIFYLDKQCNGAAATVSEILENSTTSSHYNLENESRFVILWDKQGVLNSGGGPITNGADPACVEKRVHVQWTKRCNIRIDWDATVSTGALSSIRSNNIGVLVISGNNSPVTEFTANIRLRFTDS